MLFLNAKFGKKKNKMFFSIATALRSANEKEFILLSEMPLRSYCGIFFVNAFVISLALKINYHYV